MKRILSLFLCGTLAISALSGCTTSPSSSSSSGDTSSAVSSSSSSSSSYEQLDFMVLSGPTGVGAAKLISDQMALPESERLFASATVVADNNEINNALINGSADVAAIATNVAANLYAKSDGAIQVLAVNTLGVLYILEKGDSVHSFSDLSGKTIYATGQGANPEYVLNHLLTSNGVDPESVQIEWMTAQEVSAKMVSSESAICMLPVPAATALMLQDETVRQAISLSDAWDELGTGALAMGCIVARTDYIEENPDAIQSFLTKYQESISYVSAEENRQDAAQLVAELQITPSAAVAEAAIPQCNLVYLAGDEMQETLEQYYQVLYQANPDSIGDSMPYDAFYYGIS